MNLDTNPITLGWQNSAPYPLATTNQILRELPPPMLIEGVLPRAGIMGITASPGAGKTWLALEMMRAVALGHPFLGRYPATQGGVLFVGSDSSLFDYARQWRRLTLRDRIRHDEEIEGLRNYDEEEKLIYEPSVEEMIEMFGPQWENAPFDSVRFLIQSSFYFGNSDETKRLINTAKQFHWGLADDEQEQARSLDLIVFDTLSRLSRADQNNNTEMEEVFRHVRTISEATGAAVVLLHHNSKRTEYNDGADWRGAMSQIGALDTWMQLVPAKSDRYLVGVQYKKFRGITPPDFSFRMEIMEEEEARLIATDEEEHAKADVSDIELALRELLALPGNEAGLTGPEIVDKLFKEFGPDGVAAFNDKRKLYTYVNNRLRAGTSLRKLVARGKNTAGRIVYLLKEEGE